MQDGVWPQNDPQQTTFKVAWRRAQNGVLITLTLIHLASLGAPGPNLRARPAATMPARMFVMRKGGLLPCGFLGRTIAWCFESSARLVVDGERLTIGSWLDRCLMASAAWASTVVPRWES